MRRFILSPQQWIIKESMNSLLLAWFCCLNYCLQRIVIWSLPLLLISGVRSLADQGKARGCSTNTVVIHLVTDPFSPTALQRRNAQKIWERASRLCYTGLEHSKYQRISKLHNRLQSYSNFTESVDFAYWPSYIGKVLRAACKTGQTCKMSQTSRTTFV